MDKSKLNEVVLYAISEATPLSEEAYQLKVSEYSVYYRTMIEAIQRGLIGATHLAKDTGLNLPSEVELKHISKFVDEARELPDVLHITIDRFNPIIIYTVQDVNNKPVASLVCLPKEYVEGIDFSQVEYTAYTRGLFVRVIK